MSTEADEQLDADEIEALLDAAKEGEVPEDSGTADPAPNEPTPGDAAASAAEELLDQAEANLATAVSPDLDAVTNAEAAAAQPFDMPSLDSTPDSGGRPDGLETLDDVELDVRIELGRTELLIDEVTKLKNGSVVPLDKLAGDPVDILINGRLMARGEVLVLNDNFCVRVSEILTPDY